MTAHPDRSTLQAAFLLIAGGCIKHPCCPVVLVRLDRVGPWIRSAPSGPVPWSGHTASCPRVNGFHTCHLPQPPRQPHTWQRSPGSTTTKWSGRLLLRRFLIAFRRIERLGISHLPRFSPPCARWRSAEHSTPIGLAPPRVLPRAFHQLHRLATVRTLHFRTTLLFPGPVRGGASIAPPRERPRLDPCGGSLSRTEQREGFSLTGRARVAGSGARGEKVSAALRAAHHRCPQGNPLAVSGARSASSNPL
jgi:hypothetical protein